MRRSRKSISNQKIRIRRCVVRLQRMKPQPNIKTRSVASKGLAALKKRPVAGGIVATPTSSARIKDNLRTPPIMQRNATPKTAPQLKQLKKTPQPVEVELPSTIAAGRSRRAHKPNPKYASEDVVTPRLLKSDKKHGSVGRNRRTSLSSMEDFYNADSSDENLEGDETDYTENDKDYKVSKRTVSDSDFVETVEESDDDLMPERKKAGRPKKHTKIEFTAGRTSVPQCRTASAISKIAPSTRNASNLKTPPTQLQQLRKTLGANTVSPLIMGRKRKVEESGKDALPVAPKRFILSNKASKPVITNIATRRNSPKPPQQAINGNKTSTPAAAQSQERKTVPMKPLSAIISKIQSSTKLQQTQQRSTSLTSLAKANTPKILSSNKQNTNNTSMPVSTPRTTAQVQKAKTTEPPQKERIIKKVDETPKETPDPDDFETMPTFTIVNINDIINKKGDVLISQTPAKKTAPTTERSKILSNKSSPDVSKGPQFRTSTPLIRKPPEKNGNNAAKINDKITGKTVSKLSNSSTDGNSTDKKSTPRILNSVVGRKTKPVKPVIANLDADSASCSASIFDDDEDADDIDDIDDSKLDNSSSNETEYSEGAKSMQSNAKSSANKAISKSSEPKTAAKENSLAATNVQSNKNSSSSKSTDSRKLSPEKVIVSRQGDKIIKKITCFETWYVINVPADTPDEYERNNLSMPLVQLANASKSIKLPSKMWTTKVTLYELTTLALSKQTKLTHYTGDLKEQNIPEGDRHKYQPSCVMFRRTVADRSKSQLPYDRAVIFKNKTFFTNIEGKNVKLVGAPSTISQINEIETLLHIVDTLTLQSSLVEPAATVT